MEWRQSVDFFTRRNEACGASSSQPGLYKAVSWCVSVLYLFPVHARSVRPSPLTPPSPGLARTSASRVLAQSPSASDPDTSRRLSTRSNTLRKGFPWRALFHAKTFHFLWISIFYVFYFSVRRRELLMMMWIKTNWDIRNVRDGNYNNVINQKYPLVS